METLIRNRLKQLMVLKSASRVQSKFKIESLELFSQKVLSLTFDWVLNALLVFI